MPFLTLVLGREAELLPFAAAAAAAAGGGSLSPRCSLLGPSSGSSSDLSRFMPSTINWVLEWLGRVNTSEFFCWYSTRTGGRNASCRAGFRCALAAAY